MNVCRKSLNHLLKYENIHMSNEILKDIDFNKYFNAPSILKPRGFWYSVGIEWIKWVKGEMPHWEYKYLYELDIDKSNFIIIKNYENLANFIDVYKIINDFDMDEVTINWNSIAKQYSGIEFPNYFKYYSKPMPLWYSTIDVSSGCIWNKNALRSIILISEPEEV